MPEPAAASARMAYTPMLESTSFDPEPRQHLSPPPAGSRPHPLSPSVRVNLEQITSNEDDPLPVALIGLTGQVELLDVNGNQIFGTESDIGEDAWAAALVAIVRNLTVIAMKRQNKMPIGVNIARMTTSLFVISINLVLQIGLLVFINSYLVEPTVRNVQLLYHHFLENVFDEDGHLLEDGWESYERKDEICSISMLNPLFYYAILLIWVLTGLQEIRNVQRMVSNIWVIPSCANNCDMLDFAETGNFAIGGKCHIKALTTPVRMALLSLICIPRTLIACFLGALGCRWLSASDKFSDMILNSLALSFVINIDELLYHSVLPVATRRQISETKLFYTEGFRPKSLSEVERSEWQGYIRSTLYVFLAASLLVFYGAFFQTVLPSDMGFLKTMCHRHNAVSRQVICTVNAFFNHAECYPKGHLANINGG